jgi:hypothetical protein
VPPPPSAWGAAPPAWGTPVTGAGGGPLPWYRSTAFLVLGGLAMLVLGGAVGATITFLATHAVETFDETFSSAAATTYGEGGDVATFSLAPGACALGGPDEAHDYGEATAVDCGRPHAVEHYASVEPPALGGPGGRFARGDLADFGDSACYLAFEPFVGLVYADSRYDYAVLVPSEQAWAAGVRTVHGLLYDVDADRSRGSANGSRR